tara:strand:+ start:489 stop:866 length:378 start_codon:yes stop_codon:yes gene_type:complete
LIIELIKDMKNSIIFLIFSLFTLFSYGQDICSGNGEICVIQFNASFNAANSVDWFEKLTDCSTSEVDIMTNTDLQNKYKIVVVPTILILDDGEEVARFQANIMMTMESTREEVQESIDEIIMSKF